MIAGLYVLGAASVRLLLRVASTLGALK